MGRGDHGADVGLERRLSVQSGGPNGPLLVLELRLELDLHRVVGFKGALGLGSGLVVLLLLQKDLVVQELELSRVQFGLGEERRWLFVDCSLRVLLGLGQTGGLAVLLVLGQFKVHSQTLPGPAPLLPVLLQRARF